MSFYYEHPLDWGCVCFKMVYPEIMLFTWLLLSASDWLCPFTFFGGCCLSDKLPGTSFSDNYWLPFPESAV